jgi:hypothetical protein
VKTISTKTGDVDDRCHLHLLLLHHSVQIVQPPPPTVIDLTVETIEDSMMSDVQEQKTASDNDTSAPKNKAAKGKRKHVATGNPRG